jgi:hypothetical protein
MSVTFPVGCINCNNNLLECKASPRSKGLCHYCHLNGFECFFPAAAAVASAAEALLDPAVTYPFQRNCFHCTQSHQQCQSDEHCQLQCKRCTKRGLPILYKLSSQGRHNDMKASTVAVGGIQSVLLALDNEPIQGGSETIVTEDKMISWEGNENNADDCTFGDGGEVEDNANSMDSFSGFLDPGE